MALSFCYYLHTKILITAELFPRTKFRGFISSTLCICQFTYTIEKLFVLLLNVKECRQVCFHLITSCYIYLEVFYLKAICPCRLGDLIATFDQISSDGYG